MRHGVCGINVTELRLDETGRVMKAKSAAAGEGSRAFL